MFALIAEPDLNAVPRRQDAPRVLALMPHAETANRHFFFATNTGIQCAMSWKALLGTLASALGLGASREQHNRATFTAAVIALSAKLSKADGVSLQSEEDAFKRLFQFEDGEQRSVSRLYAQAAQDIAGYEAYAREIASALSEEPDLKQDIFEALLHIASADGVLHPGEDHFLSEVAVIFGYSASTYRAMRARFVRDADDPYVVLGISHDASNEALKAHYLKLVRENHPDALAAKGLAAELRAQADRKLAAINAAWDQIERERGL